MVWKVKEKFENTKELKTNDKCGKSILRRERKAKYNDRILNLNQKKNNKNFTDQLSCLFF